MDTFTPRRQLSAAVSEARSRPTLIGGDGIIYASIIALALGLVPILLLSDRLAGGATNLARLLLCVALLSAAAVGFFLANSGFKKLAAYLLVGVLWIGVTAFAYLTEIGLRSSAIFLYIVAILYSSLLCGLVPAVAQTALTVASLTGMYWLEVNGRIGGIDSFVQKTTIFNFYLGVVVSSIGALVIAAAYQRAVEQAVAEARAANDKLARLNTSLERRVAERTRELESTVHELESFNYSVSHDLRAPLRAIHGYASRLKSGQAANLGADAVRQLERVAAEAQRMDTLLMALLGFGRLGRRPLRIVELDLSAMTERLAEIGARTQAGLRTRFAIQPGLRALGDRHLVRAALDNLIGNAIKFSRLCAAPQVEFGQIDSEVGHAFFVRDNGVGFDPAHAAHLFKPFHRLHADAEHPGIGMGLASVRRILERHGGRIWADSTALGGATFYFTLPGPS